jgi:hypothetical protein
MPNNRKKKPSSKKRSYAAMRGPSNVHPDLEEADDQSTVSESDNEKPENLVAQILEEASSNVPPRVSHQQDVLA